MIKKTVEISSLSDLKKMKERSNESRESKKLFDDKIILVDPKALHKNPHQDRWFTDEYGDKRKKEQLVSSIKKYGVKTPLKITKNNIIIGGHSRCAIARQLEMSKVPCQIARYDLEEIELRMHHIEDNYLQRGDEDKKKEGMYKELQNLVRSQYPNWMQMVSDDSVGAEKELIKIGMDQSTARRMTSADKRLVSRYRNDLKKEPINEHAEIDLYIYKIKVAYKKMATKESKEEALIKIKSIHDELIKVTL
jgi:ParB-like chromosome segregation protein Spo0J